MRRERAFVFSTNQEMKIKFTENKSKSLILINCTCLQFQIPRVNDMIKSQGPVKMKGNVFLNYFSTVFSNTFSNSC